MCKYLVTRTLSLLLCALFALPAHAETLVAVLNIDGSASGLQAKHLELVTNAARDAVRQAIPDSNVMTSDTTEAVTHLLDHEWIPYSLEQKRVRKQGKETLYTHLHLTDEFPVELTIYARDQAHFVFKSSITGKAIERASIAQLEQLLDREYPDLNIDEAVLQESERVDRFQLYESLLLALENVEQDRHYHPEGDALYHSLQVFDRACDMLSYDEEFLTAALLHDVGKAIDPKDHVASGLEAIAGFITPRTSWLIENHMLAHKVRDGTLGSRAKRRLQCNESYDELLLLAECDRAGRQPGVEAPELEEALDYLRELKTMFG